MYGRSAITLCLFAVALYYWQNFKMSGDLNEIPPIFISHGAGPCWFMDGKDRPMFGDMDKSSASAAFMKSLREKANLPRKPVAILVISAHWEEAKHTVMTSAKPSLYFDYYGFPEETYKIEWPAPGAPTVAERVCELLKNSGIECLKDSKRGFDHGVFVPLKLAYPEADVPVLQVSLRSSLDISEHMKFGEGLQPLTREGVLIIGSGQSTHNSAITPEMNRRFGEHLHNIMTNPAYSSDDRKSKIASIRDEPSFSKAHARIEHFLPAVVAAAAANYRRGTLLYEEAVMQDRMLMSYINFDK